MTPNIAADIQCPGLPEQAGAIPETTRHMIMEVIPVRARSERSVFNEILSYSPTQIQQKFSVEDAGSCYIFREKANPDHYVSVEKDKKDSFWVPVNSDFDFVRPAGSNNYLGLIDVAKHMTQAFNLPLNW